MYIHIYMYINKHIYRERDKKIDMHVYIDR